MIWLWRSNHVSARVARTILAPAELAYRAGVAARNAFAVERQPALPAISVGNLTVGGTGKTPIAAWVAGELQRLGAHPAVILRGYAGGDEIDVHRRLTPGIPVIGNADRIAGVAQAAAEGADIAVLDDAFQHRRIARVLDVVLLSADAWTGAVRLLPAGPYREPLAALRRASVIIITRKAANDGRVASVKRAIGRAIAATPIPVAVASLSLGALATLDGDERSLDTLAGQVVHAIAGIGDADAFFAQLTARGARVVAHAYADHHAFTTADAEGLARAAAGAPVVCTLKDAVKLAGRWPRQAGPVWYVSQRVEFERGREAIMASLGNALAASRTHS